MFESFFRKVETPAAYKSPADNPHKAQNTSILQSNKENSKTKQNTPQNRWNPFLSPKSLTRIVPPNNYALARTNKTRKDIGITSQRSFEKSLRADDNPLRKINESHRETVPMSFRKSSARDTNYEAFQKRLYENILDN